MEWDRCQEILRSKVEFLVLKRGARRAGGNGSDLTKKFDFLSDLGAGRLACARDPALMEKTQRDFYQIL